MNKTCLVILTGLIIYASSCNAIKIENLPLMSDAHVGMVSGIGLGIGLGFDAGLRLGNFQIGPEIEQLITDVDYSASINATRFGGFISYMISESFTLNFHAGSFNFQPNRQIIYTADGNNYILAENLDYKGSYSAISLDYLYKPFNMLITPKIALNSINEQGTLREFDLNLGWRF